MAHQYNTQMSGQDFCNLSRKHEIILRTKTLLLCWFFFYSQAKSHSCYKTDNFWVNTCLSKSAMGLLTHERMGLLMELRRFHCETIPDFPSKLILRIYNLDREILSTLQFGIKELGPGIKITLFASISF